MKRVYLVALVGLPGSGKTSTCRYLMQMDLLPFDILHLCYDNVIKFNSENPSHYKVQREQLLKSLKEILKSEDFQQMQTLLQTMKIKYKSRQHNDTIIICDDNHYYRSMRYKLFQLARDHNIGYCQIYFNCEVELALERNNLRIGQTKVSNDIIVQMNKRLEVPNILNHNWEQNTLILQSCNSNEKKRNEIVTYIKQILDKPLHMLEVSVSKPMTLTSEVHDLDLRMRKYIKEIINSKQDPNKSLLAKNLNTKRKEILKDIHISKCKKSPDDLDLNIFMEMLKNV